jgi:hypothetical protein
MDEDGLSDAIRSFILREHEEDPVQQEPPLQSQQQPSDPEPQRGAQTTSNATPTQENMLVLFVYNGENLMLLEDEATPSALAAHFGLDQNEIRLNRGDKVFTVHEKKDRFKPNVKAGKKYTVSKLEKKKISTASSRRQGENSSGECTIVVNDQRKNVPAGTIKKSVIMSLFKIASKDIRLIGYDGTVSTSKNHYDLNPGATYYARFNEQKILKKEDVEVEEDFVESFKKPLAFMAPFMAALVRVVYALSFTGDAMTFTDTIEKKEKDKTSKLHCSKKLSTCAYQVAYRYNIALEKLLKFTTKLSQNGFGDALAVFLPSSQYQKVPDDDQILQDAQDIKAFYSMIENVVECLEKAHDELEEFLKIIVKEMRTINPSIESVKISLKVETNQENRELEKNNRKKDDDCALSEICSAISREEDDDEIRPKFNDLYTISSNRKSLNLVTELADKILSEMEDKAALEDIANLLDFCAKISHCNLMHWIFALKLWSSVLKETKEGGSTTKSYKNKQHVGNRIYSTIKIWQNASLGQPLFVNLNEEVENIYEIWKKLKEEIITSQYALEICYDEED